MLIKWGSVIQAASGNIGGIQFARHRGAPIARTRTRRCICASPDILDSRLGFAIITQAWRNLTALQKLNWNLYAIKYPTQNRLGLTRRISGFAWFARTNMPRLAAAAPILYAPGQYAAGSPGTNTIIYFVQGAPYYFSITTPATQPSGYYEVFGHRPVSTSSIGNKKLRLITSIPAAGFIEYDLYSEWIAVLGDMQTNELYRIGIRYLPSNGLNTALYEATLAVY